MASQTDPPDPINTSNEKIADADSNKQPDDVAKDTLSPKTTPSATPSAIAVLPAATKSVSSTSSPNPNQLDRPLSELQVQTPSHQSHDDSHSKEHSEDRFPKLPTVIQKTDTDLAEMEYHQSNESATKSRGDGVPHHKVLSTIPYHLERLHGRKQRRNVLQMTRLRDLLDASYIARYIFCLSIGCFSFCVLAALWKFAFEINSCRYEGLHLQYSYMPFAWGFMYAFKNGLMRTVPLMLVVLPTVGISSRQRRKFIVAFVILFFVLFSAYTVYPVDWFWYRSFALLIMIFAAIVIVNFFGGYFAFWVVFPLFSAFIMFCLITNIMRVYAWTFVHQYPTVFGLVYPIYLSVLEIITYKCMLWFRLPYSIRKFFAKCCPQCCCRVEEDETGHVMTPVYYENFDNVWDQQDAFAIGYLSTRVLSRFTSNSKLVDEKEKPVVKDTAPKSPVVKITHSPIIITPQAGNSGMLNFPRGALLMSMNTNGNSPNPQTPEMNDPQLSHSDGNTSVQSVVSINIRTPREMVQERSGIIPENCSDDEMEVEVPNKQQHQQKEDEIERQVSATETLATQKTLSMSDVNNPSTPSATSQMSVKKLSPPHNLAPIDAEHVRFDTVNIAATPSPTGSRERPKSNKSSVRSKSHRYRSTEMELTVEDVWSNDILFVAGGTVIVLMESMRVAGMVALKDDIGALIFSVATSIALETAARNNLYLELIARVLRVENPPLTRFYSSILGTRVQVEYIPYFVIAIMNVTAFGPTSSCTMEYLGSTVRMSFDEYWFMYVIMIMSELTTDFVAEWTKRFGRAIGWFGTKEGGDPARHAIYAKLKTWMMAYVFIAFFAISLLAFELDFDAKQAQN